MPRACLGNFRGRGCVSQAIPSAPVVSIPPVQIPFNGVLLLIGKIEFLKLSLCLGSAVKKRWTPDEQLSKLIW